ncbi:hypothetical protein AXF42_Ash009698 [Apostasia shenzhenica]|uniref:Uncharacterized protein n=1 Tax=Apostasia shenzhenica TaxID=1088818 RepID=A0A2I0AWT9_9ASPA|nr:hypothetical protein AXF42_Ash009698 [Apostasia shenzhenica]
MLRARGQPELQLSHAPISIFIFGYLLLTHLVLLLLLVLLRHDQKSGGTIGLQPAGPTWWDC